MSTIANINGANLTRLRVLQMGSNISSCVLSQALIEDSQTSKYIVSVENLVVSTDIPIFKKGTMAFAIYPVDLANMPAIGDPVGEIEALNEVYKCFVGPVYSFLDFVHQIEIFCIHYNGSGTTAGTIDVDGRLASKKHFGLRGSPQFWNQHIIYFPDEIGRIFDGIYGEEGYYHNYQHRPMAPNAPKESLWFPNVLLPNVTREWNVAPANYLYGNNNWDLGAFATVTLKCKLDMFENRVALKIDAVLPLPFEMVVSNSNRTDNNKGANKYGFLTLDFPEGNLTHRSTVNNVLSDNLEIDQTLRTGIFRIIGDSRNTVAKRLLPGQLQDHRYELFLIRKTPQADGSVKLLEEPVIFTNGDYWSADIVFTKQV